MLFHCKPKVVSSKPTPKPTPETPSYKITFDFGKGISALSFTEEKDSALSEEQKQQIQQKENKQGHSFDGWKDGDDADISLNDIRFDSDQTFTAKGWTVSQYKVTFEMNGATAIAPQTITYPAKFTEPKKPTKASATFVNWYKDSSLKTVFDFDDAIVADTTLYAGWSYAITFSHNGGTGNVPNARTTLHGNKIIRPTLDPTKANHTFINWYSDRGLTTVFDFDTAITSATTIYGKWVELKVNFVVKSITTSAGVTLNNQGVVTGLRSEFRNVNNIVLNIPAKISNQTVQVIGKHAFYNGDVGNVNFGKNRLVKVVIPDTVTILLGRAISSIKGLTNVHLGSNVKYIGVNSLSYNKDLLSLNIPNSVTNIREEAFDFNFNWVGISGGSDIVTVPSGLKKINLEVFYYCRKITIRMVHQNPILLIPDEFGRYLSFGRSGDVGLTQVKGIQVPNASLNDYKTATGWKEYAAIITGY